jgi:hypothetical protein
MMLKGRKAIGRQQSSLLLLLFRCDFGSEGQDMNVEGCDGVHCLVGLTQLHRGEQPNGVRHRRQP